MKRSRQEKILEFIRKYDIETQEELSARLQDAGYKVTQATISRDIKELKIVKTSGANGRYQYGVPAHGGGMQNAMKFRNILRETVIHSDYAENIVVLKTYAGMAQAAAAAIDALKIEEVVGSVAGDDCILMVMRCAAIAREFNDKFASMLV